MNQAQRYLRMLYLTGQENPDCHYQAAFYLLSRYREIAERAYRFISPDGVDFDGMARQRSFSLHEWHIVKVAHSLFSMSDPGIPNYELAHFSHGDFESVLDAMYITNGQYKVSVLDCGETASICLDKSGYLKVKEYIRDLERQCEQYSGIKEGLKTIENHS